MRAHIGEFRLVAMCRVLGVHRSGYYAWVRQSASLREREDQRLLGLIKHSWLASGGVYGHRRSRWTYAKRARPAAATACSG